MRARRASGPVAAAALALALAPIGLGCWDNTLPPKPLPKDDTHAALPRWYPEAPWSEKSGQEQIFIEGKIVFATNKATIRPGSEKVLKTLKKFLDEHPEVTRMRIEGHTDARASEEHNMELSARRALAVGDWLVDHGVDAIRLIAVGFGESRPLGPNDLAAGRSDNRRTEFHVAEVNGRPYGGRDPYAGGYALEVLSLEERQRRADEAKRAKLPPPRPVYNATGDEVKPVKRQKPTIKHQSEAGEPPPSNAKPEIDKPPPAPSGGT